MIRMPPVIVVIVWGAIASLIVGAIYLFLVDTGTFNHLGLPMSMTDNLAAFFGRKAVEGGVAGLLFLLPLWSHHFQWKRGIGLGFIYSFYYFLILYPQRGLGYFGMQHGTDFAIKVTIVGLVMALLWGVITGWLLRWSRLRA